MKGDFSKWTDELERNDAGVLHQQGRVLLDSDWNDQTRISMDWRDTAGRHIIGPRVAAVPASQPDSFKVKSVRRPATHSIAHVAVPAEAKIEVTPGTAWVDGLVVRLEGDPLNPAGDVERTATALGTAQADSPAGSPGTSSRQAVVLEAWREAINGFQTPMTLIEPALGGPDTTERARTAVRFRLVAVGTDATCEDVRDTLARLDEASGTLKVSLKPVTTSRYKFVETLTGTARLSPARLTDDECPTVERGGYSGFEHCLYRIEIAEVNQSQPMFKWSQFNGGLVGRGTCDVAGPEKKITIKANKQAIETSGIFEFYVEVVEFDASRGHWRTTYGAEATLQDDGLMITNEYYKEATLPSGEVFFRLWNGIREIDDFPTVQTGQEPRELRDGIRLEFERPSNRVCYAPGDYWIFPVRAGQQKDEDLTDLERVMGRVLVGKKDSAGQFVGERPHGVEYHRVPLAVIEWHPNQLIVRDEIKDCRKVFPPIVDLPKAVCCTAVRPDEDLAEAIEGAVKNPGACLCLLPGDHVLRRQVRLSGNLNLRISGFGRASRLHISQEVGENSPFYLRDAGDVTFDSFAVFGLPYAPIWNCREVGDLTIAGMFASMPLSGKEVPVIAVGGDNSHGWVLKDSLFVGPTGIGGTALFHSTISGNAWSGSFRGIDLDSMMGVRIERNQWSGLAAPIRIALDTTVAAIAPTVSTAASTAGLRIVDTHLRLLDFSLAPKRKAIGADYVALDAADMLDASIVDNQFMSSVGINTGMADNCEVRGNRFFTTAAGLMAGAAYDLRFVENRIGRRMGRTGSPSAIPCGVGLRILSDSVGCEFVDNHFDNAHEGILFESDSKGEMGILNDYSANVLALKTVETGAAKNMLRQATDRVLRLHKKLGVLRKPEFRIAATSRTLIQGNVFECSKLGIEWSGTRTVSDFRISDNAFIGCQEVAIQIEPDERVSLLRVQIGTNVRIIEKNRFQVHAGALRSALGGIRVERNDIQVLPSLVPMIPLPGLMRIVATDVYGSTSMETAADENDVPTIRVKSKEAYRSVEKNPNAVKTASLSKNISETFLTTHAHSTGDSRTDTAYVITVLANLEIKDFVVAMVNKEMERWTSSLEGFVLNLGGTDNYVTHNRIDSQNPLVFGGVVYHILSGEVRDNEINVSRIGLLLSGKVLQAGSRLVEAEITGNSVAITGVRAGSDKSSSKAALVIPALTPGHVSITRNHFEGSVHVGCDPMSAMALYKKDKVGVVKEAFKYNLAKADNKTVVHLVSEMRMVAETAPAMITTMLDIVPAESAIMIAPSAGMTMVKPGLRFDADPHRTRTIVQFIGNRVVCGAVGIARTAAGAYLAAKDLQADAYGSLIVNMTGNVIDYWAVVVGRDLVIVGNHSQLPIWYRKGREIEHAANIPGAEKYDPQWAGS